MFQLLRYFTPVNRILSVLLKKLLYIMFGPPGSLLDNSKPAVVLPTMPGTQEKQTRAGSLARQGGTGMNNTQEWMQRNSQLTPPAQHRGSSSFQQEAELAELRTKNREMEAALRDVMTEGEGAGMMTRFLEAKGHSGVVGMIALGGQLPSEAK